MTQPNEITSILTADIGSAWTHVALLDQVEGTYRLIARAEAPTCVGRSPRPLEAVVAAVRRIERIAQRSLLDELDELITPEIDSLRGVDTFVACGSAAAPLACALIGLTADVSLQSAARACSGAMATVTQAIALSQRRGAERLAQLLPLEAEPPDVIVLIGGYDNGPVAPLLAMAELLAALFADAPRGQRPAIIFAGNQEARRPVVQALGAEFAVAVVDNVRPNETTESPLELQRELARIYRERQLSALPGMETIARWSACPVQSTHEALSVALQYLARRNELPAGVLGFDVGSRTTGFAAADRERIASVQVAELGSGAGLRGLLAERDLDEIAQWLPYQIGEQELIAQIENASLRPGGIPQILDDLLLVHGASRVAVREAHERWQAQQPDDRQWARSYDLIAGRGGALAHSPQDGLVALLMLDALQPVGLARLVLDWGSLWAQLGALAAVAPLAASQVFARDSLRELGTAICPSGDLRPGEPALRLSLEAPGRAPKTLEVTFGQVAKVPLALSETATVKIWPHPHLDVGLGEPGLAVQAQVRGGTLGLIIDARGRPLELPRIDSERVLWLQQWIKALCAT